MSLEIITDQKIIARIEKERNESSLKPYIDMLVEKFKDLHIQEMGGTVRDIIISEWYKNPFELRDWDLIVDDSKEEVDLFKRCKGLPGEIKQNYFGNARWRVEDYEFDITKYSTKKNKKSPITLEEFFKGCDFNIGTIAYCWEHKKILSLNALDGIRKMEISLMNVEKDRPQATIVRAINFERRLKGFTLDKKTLKYIRETYTPNMNTAISDYIKYKGISQSIYMYVIKRLSEIIKQ